MAQKSGFFNALLNNGTYDRKYDADDYSDNMGAIISTGVRRSGDNDLRVTATSGMVLSVSAGRAWIQGHWFNNTSAFTGLTVPIAPIGDMSRIDRVVLRLDLTVEGRNIMLGYLQGTAAISPTAPALTRNNNVYEIGLADIAVSAGTTSIVQSNITDLRADQTLCGWITSPVGYDDYFENLDTEFNEWFEEKRNTLASVTLFKEYHWRTILNSATNVVTFDIAQWTDDGTDILQVYVNGLREIESVDYSVSGSTITFTNVKMAGAEIDVFVNESIDGTGLGSVSDRVTALEQQVADLEDLSEYNYICNGSTDNVNLSNIIKSFLEAANDYNSLKINVYGTFGIAAPYRGDGSSSAPYRWFDLGFSTTYTRKAIIDFANCTQISIVGKVGLNQIFYGSNFELDNLDLTTSSVANGVNITIVNGYGGVSSKTICKNCRFWLTATGNTGYIGNSGTYDECRGSVAVQGGNGFCFVPSAGHCVRINGGEYYGYTATSTAKSGVISVISSSAVGIIYSVSAPTLSRSGFFQTNSIYHTNGYLNCTDLISALSVSVTAGSSNVRGTLPISIMNTI